MKLFLNIVILFLLAFDIFSASTKFYGFVENGQSCDIVIYAKVTLDDSLVTFTNAVGYFKFDNIRFGNHIIIIEKEKFFTKTDTIKISKSQKEFRFVASLTPKPIKINISSIKNYIDYFRNKSPDEILEITIDSSKFGSHGLEVYSSALNKTGKTIYLIRDFKLCRRINRYIWNSKGELIKRNSTYIDFLPCETILGITSSDIIVIHPNEKVNYPVILFPLHNFANYPKDIYKIKIEYEFSDSTKKYALSKLGSTLLSNSKELFLNSALTGKFISKNEIIVDNSDIVKQ